MAYLKHQIIKFKLLILGMQTDSIYIHLVKWEIILIHLALGKKVNSARDLSRITPFMHFSHAILCHRVILSKESIYIYISQATRLDLYFTQLLYVGGGNWAIS